MAKHEHDWYEYEVAGTIKRFACECGAKGWRKMWHPVDRIREYAHPERIKPPAAEPNAQPRAYGRNATGGYLPPGGGGSN